MKTKKLLPWALLVLTLTSLFCLVYLTIAEKELILSAKHFVWPSVVLTGLFTLYWLTIYLKKQWAIRLVRKTQNYTQLHHAYVKYYIPFFDYRGIDFPVVVIIQAKSFDIDSLCPEELIFGFEKFNSLVGKKIFDKFQKDSKGATRLKVIQLKTSLAGTSLKNVFDENLKESLSNFETENLLQEFSEIIKPWVVEIVQGRLVNNHDLLIEILSLIEDTVNARSKDKYILEVLSLALPDIISEFSNNELKAVFEEGFLEEMIQIELGRRVISTPKEDNQLPETNQTIENAQMPGAGGNIAEEES